MAKPKAYDILDLARELKDDNADRDRMWDRLDRIYDQEVDTDNPEIKNVVMPYGTNAVDLVTDLGSSANYNGHRAGAKRNPRRATFSR